jgi:hypothetical protein
MCVCIYIYILYMYVCMYICVCVYIVKRNDVTYLDSCYDILYFILYKYSDVLQYRWSSLCLRSLFSKGMYVTFYVLEIIINMYIICEGA